MVELWNRETVELWDPEQVARWDRPAVPAPAHQVGTSKAGGPGPAALAGLAGGQPLDVGQPAAQPIRALHRAEVIRAWLAATDRAIAALGDWRRLLVTLRIADTLGQVGAGGAGLDAALQDLDAAGLGEWAEWGAGQDLDGLTAALFPGK